MTVPARPKIYHIVHVDRLPSIISDGFLWCDAEIVKRSSQGTTIGMSKIKHRRLYELTLNSHPDLYVGQCVPFYFCPRSIMLYLIYRGNHSELDYRGGQDPIIHLIADLKKSVQWAESNGRRWAFTLSNAGSNYFDDRCNLAQLGEIEWDAVRATNWAQCQEGKQAEFLLEYSFPWQLIEHIGVYSRAVYSQVLNALPSSGHRPQVEIKQEWYY